jgi:mutator protein MutT
MIRVSAAVIEERNCLLICQRRASGIFPLKWEFPGGKLRPGEAPRDGLTRELREELCVESQIGRELAVVSHRYAELGAGVKVAFFLAKLSAQPRNLAFEQCKWVRPSELPRYDFLAADRVVVARLVHCGTLAH